MGIRFYADPVILLDRGRFGLLVLALRGDVGGRGLFPFGILLFQLLEFLDLLNLHSLRFHDLVARNGHRYKNCSNQEPAEGLCQGK